MEYTQESMDNAVGRISSICPDLGGCDLLGLLRSIYSTPHLHGHARQVSGGQRVMGIGMGVNNRVNVDFRAQGEIFRCCLHWELACGGHPYGQK